MELGGSDPFIVLDDVDLERATDLALTARLTNSGQICINAKRFFIHEAIYDEFKDLLVKKVATQKVGNQSEEDTEIGPLARKDLLEGLKGQVRTAIEQGAKVVYGDEGQLEADDEIEKGNFFTPMILEDIPE